MTLVADDTPKPKSFATELVEMAKTIVYALLIALVLRVVLFEPFTIPSASMEPGLLTGDYVVTTKWDYGWSRHSIPFSPPMPSGRLFGHPAQRGDVVVFRLPRDITQTYVKRIIGVPGDRIQVKEGVVYVNDKPIVRTPDGRQIDPDQPYLTVERYRETKANGQSYVTFDEGQGHEGDNTDVYVVPEGYYFAMGDNRDNSLDSRWPPQAQGVGFIPADNLVGKAQIILASWKGGASVLKPWTWVLRFDPSRLLKPIR